MILPSKHLAQSRAIIGVGADILKQLSEPCSISELWNKIRTAQSLRQNEPPLSFDWFVLTLSFLYALNAIEMNEGVVIAQREIE
ncbi:ABC-three component system middle component 6 [Vampirovibrio sp.]|uniref:ABC-three component system middle component 6 n=1 Tax=Vampirovibrio sp. TaxID=2717857 RepID=UPI00359462B4